MIWIYTVCLDLFGEPEGQYDLGLHCLLRSVCGGPEEQYDLGLHCLPRPV